jgi:hypothetical protein
MIVTSITGLVLALTDASHPGTVVSLTNLDIRRGCEQRGGLARTTEVPQYFLHFATASHIMRGLVKQPQTIGPHGEKRFDSRRQWLKD